MKNTIASEMRRLSDVVKENCVKSSSVIPGTIKQAVNSVISEEDKLHNVVVFSVLPERVGQRWCTWCWWRGIGGWDDGTAQRMSETCCSDWTCWRAQRGIHSSDEIQNGEEGVCTRDVIEVEKIERNGALFSIQLCIWLQTGREKNELVEELKRDVQSYRSVSFT